MSSIDALRREYRQSALLESEVDADPVAQFLHWFGQARAGGVPEPNAMILATVDAAGRPATRTVLLKGVEAGTFQFYTNHASAKAGQIGANPQVSLCFFWAELERQVRIDGVASKLPRAVAEAYFATRPRESRLGAWASQQSRVVPDRAFLERDMEAVRARFEGVEQIPMPDHWGGYAVTPTGIEFWQGRPGRLHDRLRYRLEADVWILERLSP